MNPVKLVLRLRVEFTGAAVGINAAYFRADEVSNFLSEQGEVDRVIFLNREQQRGPVAADFSSEEWNHIEWSLKSLGLKRHACKVRKVRSGEEDFARISP